ncbi:flavin-binding monooxygenase-like protein [Exophiala viscosa]|uniref:flavin-binding monooxygenase-like protein n=1 Tax=Exophiala viscosa TaxID=2486360 RepID=UPI002199540E|nr:flavin-binding monooxygenase-like protein [Exophiala viscosa]
MVFDVNKAGHEVNGTNGESNNTADESGPGGKYGYRLGHSQNGYNIPDYVLGDGAHRRVKVLTIGAGVSGILMAYLLQKHGENVEHVVYEKNGDIGGTWLENRYPGCACDVPSHAYTYAFALNADWPKYLSPSDDIFRYLTRVVECFGLRRYMKFNHAIQAAKWNEEEGKWHVTIHNWEKDEVIEETCDVLISANGLLNSWKLPEEVEGLKSFKGKLLHTARWPDEYGATQWKEDRVAVIGSGATSIQVVPTLQPHVKSMDVFVRTPVWFAEIADHSGDNYDYTPDQRETFKNDNAALIKQAKAIEGKLNTAMGLKAMMTQSAEAKIVRDYFTKRMRQHLYRDEIYEQLLPSFSPGCRRLTPGNPYMKAIQESNVNLHRCAVTKVTPNSVIGSDGTEVEVDTIICATGFDVSYKPRFSVVGRNGVSLQDKWKTIPEGYLGLAVPEMPNYFVFQGPTFPVSNGSVMGPLQSVGNYIVQVIQKMQKDHLHSLVPKQDVTDAFNEHAQTWIRGTCWAESSCRSWYKNNETGRVNSVWPGSSLHYCEMTASPRYEDYEIKYDNKHNMWAFMGLGFTKNQLTEGGDLSPYITENGLEKKFYSFVLTEEEEKKISERKLKVREVF